jgi:excisionase family DNA binding protein
VNEYISIRRDRAAKIQTNVDETKRALRDARTHRVEPISGKYADVPQAANYLRISIPTVRKMLSTKRLTRYHVGTRVLILVAELDSLVIKDKPAEGEDAA